MFFATIFFLFFLLIVSTTSYKWWGNYTMSTLQVSGKRIFSVLQDGALQPSSREPTVYQEAHL
jgi:hypothetical protein